MRTLGLAGVRWLKLNPSSTNRRKTRTVAQQFAGVVSVISDERSGFCAGEHGPEGVRRDFPSDGQPFRVECPLFRTTVSIIGRISVERFAFRVPPLAKG